MQNISFIISNYNTIKYSQWCYNSLRKNLQPSHEIVFINDGSTDGTTEWLASLQSIDTNIKVHHNSENIGIAYSYNKGVELASNELVCVLHTDMYIPPKFDEKIIDCYESGYGFVTCLRIEPPLYPESNDKILIDFGTDLNSFDELRYLEYCNSYKPTTNGQDRTCFPWLTSKSIYNEVGGNDCLFLKYMVDDDDFYFRLAKHGIKYFQTFETTIYHLCSRSSKFENDVIDTNGSDKWKLQHTKSTRNFIRKWGFPQWYVYNQDNSININLEKYNVGLICKNFHLLSSHADSTLYHIEPFFDNIYIDVAITFNQNVIAAYKNIVQKETILDLQSKFRNLHESNYCNDILIEIDTNNISQEVYNYITNLATLIPRLENNKVYPLLNGKIKIHTKVILAKNQIKNDRIYVI